MSLPAPDDPRPRWQPLTLEVAGQTIEARNDSYSDRIRCDHPPEQCDSEVLGGALVAAAREHGRGRVLVLASTKLRSGLESAGLGREATMPSFYEGAVPCDVMGMALDPARARLTNLEAVTDVDELIWQGKPGPIRTLVPTDIATRDDAPAIAALVTQSFEHYPTPTGVPEYVAAQIAEGIPFRVVRDDGEIVACASADLVRAARTAELTDCATRPDQRGRGLMQAVLAGLMDDLRELGYPTAFTLARASIPGVNLAFQRLGFVWRGQMTAACRIGGGIEDMNVWSRRL